MEAAVAGKDSRQVSWEAHALKGVFLTVGAEALSAACQELIKMGELAEFSLMESTCRAIRNEWNDLKEQASGYLKACHVGSIADL